MALTMLSIHGVKGIEIKGLKKLMGGGIVRDIIIHTSEHDSDDFEISLFAWGEKTEYLKIKGGEDGRI